MNDRERRQIHEVLLEVARVGARKGVERLLGGPMPSDDRWYAAGNEAAASEELDQMVAGTHPSGKTFLDVHLATMDGIRQALEDADLHVSDSDEWWDAMARTYNCEYVKGKIADRQSALAKARAFLRAARGGHDPAAAACETAASVI